MLLLLLSMPFYVFALSFAVANWMILDMWRKGYSKPLMALAGPLSALIGVLIYPYDYRWVVWVALFITDPGGALFVALCVVRVVRRALGKKSNQPDECR